MQKRKTTLQVVLKVASYFLVGAIALTAGWYLNQSANVTQAPAGSTKLAEIQSLIDQRYIGDVDAATLEDGAAAGMVAATGDRWSYYIPASDYQSHVEQMQNAYVGIGVTISTENTEKGFEVLQVEPTGGARAAGIVPGDIITEVEGQKVTEIGVDAAKEMIRGDEGTQVQLTVLRGQQEQKFTVIRQLIQVEVARGEMLEGNIGLVTINNFDERCADETLAAVEKLVGEGAVALIFDVRNNPGGYKNELVKILDYLLPEGALFRSVSYTGVETVDNSDADCLELPMAVMVNGNSYSAAEFFAAALSEYQWAKVVGNPTTGKSRFQSTFQLSDGSAVNLSIGKYCTPNGVDLAEVGGLTPDIVVEIDDETAAKIYADLMDPMEDPQILAAMEALK